MTNVSGMFCTEYWDICNYTIIVLQVLIVYIILKNYLKLNKVHIKNVYFNLSDT